MAKAYFGSRLSENIIKTPEGYLVCKNVPIARIGVQKYLGQEFGAPRAERIYDVSRPASEVFDKAAMASFEGKPVTDEHPGEDVTPENYTRFMKGVCRDVRRGDGEFSGCLMADLIIYDADMIREIESGKREISCGYDCIWSPTGDSSYDQLDIRGNHIAIVDRGRAGHRVAIRDAQIKAKEKKSMKKSNIFGRMLSVFAKDADTTPEELLEAARLSKGGEDSEPEPEPESKPVEKPAIDAELDARLRRIEDALENLSRGSEEPEPEPEEEPDALDELEEEISGEGEEPEPEAEEAEDEDEVVEPSEEINRDSREARDAAIACIRGFKPFVASLPARDRKRVSDSLAMLIRGNLGRDEQYGELQNIRQKSAGRRQEAANDADYGRSIRDRFNPHYNKK